MRTKELPKVGDIIEITKTVKRPNGERVHPAWLKESVCASRFKDIHGNPQECRCSTADLMVVVRQMRVEKIMWFADNSIEAHGVMLDNGEKWHTMLEAPHGDVCF